MTWTYSLSHWERDSDRGGIDNARSREKLKVIHMLVRSGAKWRPKDAQKINYARKSLLKLTPDYTLEFVWIMAKYSACTRESIERLVRTPTIKRHTAKCRERLREVIDMLPEELIALTAID